MRLASLHIERIITTGGSSFGALLARTGRLAVTAVVLSAPTAAVFVYMVLVGDPEPPATGRRRVTAPPGPAARPWLLPAAASLRADRHSRHS